MWNLMLLTCTIYFLAITLVVYHLQQEELDRIQLRLDENSRVLDQMYRYLHTNFTHSSAVPLVQRSDGFYPGLRLASSAAVHLEGMRKTKET